MEMDVMIQRKPFGLCVVAGTFGCGYTPAPHPSETDAERALRFAGSLIRRGCFAAADLLLDGIQVMEI